MADKLFHDLVTLFVVVNPIGVVPLFIAVAGHERSGAAEDRRSGDPHLDRNPIRLHWNRSDCA